MSQQEFIPESQSQQAEQNEDGFIAQPYYWSTRPGTGPMPRNDPPSSYEETMPPVPPYSYRAQDSAQHIETPQRSEGEKLGRATRDTHSQQQQQRFSPDGDAFEYGYRGSHAYRNRWQQGQQVPPVPPWARPQRNGRRVLRWIALIVLGIILLKPLVALIVVALAGIGILALAILLPFIIFFGIIAALIIITVIVLAVLGIPLGLAWRQWRNPRSWRRW